MLQNDSSTKTGFTLVEIMAVIVILGIFSTVALLNYSKTIEQSRAEEGKEILMNLYRAQTAYAIDHSGGFTLILSNLDVTIPTLRYFDAPTLNTFDHFAQAIRNSFEN